MARPNVTTMSVEELEAALQLRLLGRVHQLHVELHSHGLVLRGWTRTYYVKQVAQHAAMEASGLPIRANEIEVR